MPLDIGGMDQRITLESPSRTPDEYGQEKPTWTAGDALWASVEDLSGRKLEAAKQVHPEVTVEVIIRYRQGVTSEMRVNHLGRALNILAVLRSKERKKYLKLMCVERADAVRDQG